MVYAKGALPNVTAEATYYAHFTETTLKWKVTFNANGGICTTDYKYVDKLKKDYNLKLLNMKLMAPNIELFQIQE